MRPKKTHSIVEIVFVPLADDEKVLSGKRTIKEVNVIDDIDADELSDYLRASDTDRRFHLFGGPEIQWSEKRTIQLGEPKQRKPRAPRGSRSEQMLAQHEENKKRGPGRPKKVTTPANGVSESASEQ